MVIHLSDSPLSLHIPDRPEVVNKVVAWLQNLPEDAEALAAGSLRHVSHLTNFFLF